jgi:hypothetical protein
VFSYLVIIKSMTHKPTLYHKSLSDVPCTKTSGGNGNKWKGKNYGVTRFVESVPTSVSTSGHSSVHKSSTYVQRNLSGSPYGHRNRRKVFEG